MKKNNLKRFLASLLAVLMLSQAPASHPAYLRTSASLRDRESLLRPQKAVRKSALRAIISQYAFRIMTTEA